jgi:hypothetical protein
MSRVWHYILGGPSTTRAVLRPLLLVYGLAGTIFFVAAILRLAQGHLYGGWTLFHLVWPTLLWIMLVRGIQKSEG